MLAPSSTSTSVFTNKFAKTTRRSTLALKSWRRCTHPHNKPFQSLPSCWTRIWRTKWQPVCTTNYLRTASKWANISLKSVQRWITIWTSKLSIRPGVRQTLFASIWISWIKLRKSMTKLTRKLRRRRVNSSRKVSLTNGSSWSRVISNLIARRTESTPCSTYCPSRQTKWRIFTTNWSISLSKCTEKSLASSTTILKCRC